jgi:hypothetical protein
MVWLDRAAYSNCGQGRPAEPVASAKDDHKLTPLQRSLDHEVNSCNVVPPLPITEDGAPRDEPRGPERPRSLGGGGGGSRRLRRAESALPRAEGGARSATR